jgi:DNA repair protein RadA/Sms
MILAVLERRAHIALNDKDVYVSTVGGVKLTEPGADLAIALALASAANDRPLAHDLAAFGEISLAGEVRPVSSGRTRAAEAKRLGFTTIIDDEARQLTRALTRAFGGR